jgi:hypothetical protein
LEYAGSSTDARTAGGGTGTRNAGGSTRATGGDTSARTAGDDTSARTIRGGTGNRTAGGSTSLSDQWETEVGGFLGSNESDERHEGDESEDVHDGDRWSLAAQIVMIVSSPVAHVPEAFAILSSCLLLPFTTFLGLVDLSVGE